MQTKNCMCCNLDLPIINFHKHKGRFKDNIQFLKNAIKYLKQNGN